MKKKQIMEQINEYAGNQVKAKKDSDSNEKYNE